MSIAVQTAVMVATTHTNNMPVDTPTDPLPLWAVWVCFGFLLTFVVVVSWLIYKIWKIK